MPFFKIHRHLLGGTLLTPYLLFLSMSWSGQVVIILTCTEYGVLCREAFSIFDDWSGPKRVSRCRMSAARPAQASPPFFTWKFSTAFHRKVPLHTSDRLKTCSRSQFHQFFHPRVSNNTSHCCIAFVTVRVLHQNTRLLAISFVLGGPAPERTQLSRLKHVRRDSHP